MIRSQLLYIDKEGMSRKIFCGMGVEGNLAKWRDERHIERRNDGNGCAGFDEGDDCGMVSFR